MPERRLLDDCFLTDSERLRHDEALAILRERVGPVVGVETVPLGEALGRILAETVASPRNVPAADNAAVDGYAYATRTTRRPAASFPVAARVAAGHPSPLPHVAGAAARIFTGAIMPAGADTVAMQEDCETHSPGRARLRRHPARPEARRQSPQGGRGSRRAAHGRRAGHAAPAAGDRRNRLDRARPRYPSSAACAWRSFPPATRSCAPARRSGRARSTIPTIFCWPPCCDGGLRGRLTPASCRTTRQRCAPRLARLPPTHDAVLTTGGASRGEEDHLVTSLDAVGKRHLWQLAVKPGRPMSFGQIGDCPVVALPGNPVAAFVCFLLYVRPMLAAMGGGAWPEPQRFLVAAGFRASQNRKTGRREFLRGRLCRRTRGRLAVQKFPRDGSGLITSLREADGLIEIAEDVAAVRRGDPVAFLPFSLRDLASPTERAPAGGLTPIPERAFRSRPVSCGRMAQISGNRLLG